MLTLQYKGQGFFTAFVLLVVCAGLGVCCEWNVVIIAIKFIRCTTFGMHPDTVLQHGVPRVAAASTGMRIVVPNFAWVDGVWILRFSHGFVADDDTVNRHAANQVSISNPRGPRLRLNRLCAAELLCVSVTQMRTTSQDAGLIEGAAYAFLPRDDI